MSLLLDALKKAEEAKRQASAAESTGAAAIPTAPLAATELSLEPVVTPPAAQASAPPPGPTQLPALSDHLDSVDADLAAVQNAPPMRRGPATEQKRTPPPKPADNNADRDAIRNVFAAKGTPPPNRQLLWLGLGAVGLLATGIGGWLFWQLQSVGTSSLSARPVAAATLPPAAVPATPIATPIAAPPTPPQPPPAAPVMPFQPEPAPMETRPEKPARAAPPPAEAEGPVRISRGEVRMNPALTTAYERLQANDLGAAAKSYEQVLHADPKNTDALLGMAAIAQRTGQPGQAETWYIRALEADPKDVNAQAGLINLRGQSDPAEAESRLKSLLAMQPESASLNFALGNLYAGQKRWPDAQLAYFNAHTVEPANPDYLFNLASSLDHMHMPKLALEYYQAALAASANRKPGFDTAQVQARVIELQR
ncbi:MAG: tetratricopeptide repeat protein [Rhodocyclaceae bacterium]